LASFWSSSSSVPLYRYDWGLIFVCLGLCLASRAVAVFGLSAVANRFRKRPINLRMQVMSVSSMVVPFPRGSNVQILMWWAGLRGVVAFA